MSATVIEIDSEQRTEEAWQALRSHRARIIDDPKCLLDRGFIETDARLEDRFKRLYLRGLR